MNLQAAVSDVRDTCLGIYRVQVGACPLKNGHRISRVQLNGCIRFRDLGFKVSTSSKTPFHVKLLLPRKPNSRS